MADQIRLGKLLFELLKIVQFIYLDNYTFVYYVIIIIIPTISHS